MSRKRRRLAAPIVVAAPSGARIRTRLRVSPEDERVLRVVGEHLGSLAGRDLAERCAIPGDNRKHSGRAERKKRLTAESSSRWAGTITRTSGDQWERGLLNLLDEAQSLRRAMAAIEARLAAPVGGSAGRTRGYATKGERWQKQRRRQILGARLSRVEARTDAQHPRVVRGGVRLARNRHHLEEADLTEVVWMERWKSARMFLTADGEADKAWGNETIRVHPDEGWCEVPVTDPTRSPVEHTGSCRHLPVLSRPVLLSG